MNAGYERLLAEILRGRPSLSGAACEGRHELFDPAAPHEDAEGIRYRHDAARQVCASCTAQDRCAEWASGAKVVGVVAGRLRSGQRDKEDAA